MMGDDVSLHACYSPTLLIATLMSNLPKHMMVQPKTSELLPSCSGFMLEFCVQIKCQKLLESHPFADRQAFLINGLSACGQ